MVGQSEGRGKSICLQLWLNVFAFSVCVCVSAECGEGWTLLCGCPHGGGDTCQRNQLPGMPSTPQRRRRHNKARATDVHQPLTGTWATPASKATRLKVQLPRTQEGAHLVHVQLDVDLHIQTFNREFMCRIVVTFVDWGAGTGLARPRQGCKHSLI